MTLWRLSGSSKVIVSTTGKLVNCASCPCGGIDTTCCEVPVPSTLTGTITNKTGDYVGMGNQFSAVYGDDPSDPTAWYGIPTGVSCCAPLDPWISVSCVSGSWYIIGAASCYTSWTLVSVSCSPFELVFDHDNVPNICTGTFRLTFTR